MNQTLALINFTVQVTDNTMGSPRNYTERFKIEFTDSPNGHPDVPPNKQENAIILSQYNNSRFGILEVIELNAFPKTKKVDHADEPILSLPDILRECKDRAKDYLVEEEITHTETKIRDHTVNIEAHRADSKDNIEHPPKN